VALAAELARIDPAAPSARIAEITIFRPTRMAPPWFYRGQQPDCMAPVTRTAHLNKLGELPTIGNSIT